MSKNIFYPLQFQPYYKPVMWGGGNLAKILNRELPDDAADPIGEAWELCDRDDVQSVVLNGSFAGKTITELVQNYPAALLGTKFRGGRFPLLIKIIDAGQKLSLQVHPDESACEWLGNGAQPKTEMWYIIHAEPGAKIIAGLQPGAETEEFLSKASSPDCEKSLVVYDSKPGDAYFIKAGLVHAIGAGNLLLEVQQNSDTTYRISDWGRVGSDGKPRQLHVEESRKSINSSLTDSPLIPRAQDPESGNRIYSVIENCPFFHVEDLRLSGDWEDTTDGSSFHLITAVNQPVKIVAGDNTLELCPGASCLIPACCGTYRIEPSASTVSTVIKTTL